MLGLTVLALEKEVDEELNVAGDVHVNELAMEANRMSQCRDRDGGHRRACRWAGRCRCRRLVIEESTLHIDSDRYKIANPVVLGGVTTTPRYPRYRE